MGSKSISNRHTRKLSYSTVIKDSTDQENAAILKEMFQNERKKDIYYVIATGKMTGMWLVAMSISGWL